MKRIGFIVDGSAGINNNEIPDVYVAPSIVNKKDGANITSYKDPINITVDQVSQMLTNGDDISTAATTMGDMVNTIESIYDKYDMIIVFPIHPKLSGAINTWNIAAQDYPKVAVIPQYALSFLTKIQIEEIKKIATTKDITKQDVIDFVESFSKKWAGFLVVPDVSQLVKGGRVSNFKSLLIKMLNLKLIISYDREGLIFADKSSKNEGCAKIIHQLFEQKLQLSNKKIAYAGFLSSCYNKKYDITPLIDVLKKEFNIEKFEPTIYTKMPSTITAHTGPNYIAIILITK